MAFKTWEENCISFIKGANMFFRKKVFSIPATEMELHRIYGKADNKDKKILFQSSHFVDEGRNLQSFLYHSISYLPILEKAVRNISLRR